MYVVGIRTFYKSIKSEALYKNVKTKEKSGKYYFSKRLQNNLNILV